MDKSKRKYMDDKNTTKMAKKRGSDKEQMNDALMLLMIPFLLVSLL